MVVATTINTSRDIRFSWGGVANAGEALGPVLTENIFKK